MLNLILVLLVTSNAQANSKLITKECDAALREALDHLSDIPSNDKDKQWNIITEHVMEKKGNYLLFTTKKGEVYFAHSDEGYWYSLSKGGCTPKQKDAEFPYSKPSDIPKRKMDMMESGWSRFVAHPDPTLRTKRRVLRKVKSAFLACGIEEPPLNLPVDNQSSEQ